MEIIFALLSIAVGFWIGYMLTSNYLSSWKVLLSVTFLLTYLLFRGSFEYIFEGSSIYGISILSLYAGLMLHIAGRLIWCWTQRKTLKLYARWFLVALSPLLLVSALFIGLAVYTLDFIGGL